MPIRQTITNFSNGLFSEAGRTILFHAIPWVIVITIVLVELMSPRPSDVLDQGEEYQREWEEYQRDMMSVIEASTETQSRIEARLEDVLALLRESN